MQLDINREEKAILLEMLNENLGTLREQIYHSTTTDFKARLKERERQLRELIRKASSLDS